MYIMCLSKGVSALKRSIDEGVVPNNKLGFVPTAGDTYDDPYFVIESRDRLRDLGLDLIDMDLVHESYEELIKKLDWVDGIYVAGGNTFFLLHQMQLKQLDSVFTERIKNGLPYFGESAGAVVLTSSIEPAKPLDNPDAAPELTSLEGLGLIDFFPLPHVNRQKYKATFDTFINANKDTLNIVQFRDDQAVLTRDGIHYEVLQSEISPLSSVN